ncbi:transcriptional regulator [Vibrio sp. TH_r3]|uniref:winged helix-turn-helix domain-containing protein n=1 Tax=Vibrio sp. TH_r3 TaxID=3082084 RepID=UPI0029537DE9|nr:transcriptional regulator [Vibrio sp. TH_r3]MDV7104073.1 transcriptional regulator [Vibrio sp. TH_r3]
MTSIGTKFLLAQRFVFDPNNDSLVDKTNSNELNRLGSNESRILLLFSTRPNQIITRDELHDFVWREQGFQVDDSSLTQAISTLRRVLSDSTKTPQFIKTVPKRGYQFISSVEKTVPLLSSLNENKVPDIGTILSKTNVTASHRDSDKPDSNQNLSNSNNNSTTWDNFRLNSKQHRIVYRLIWLAAALLPICVYLSIEPAPSKFKLIDTIQGIPLQTTERHPPLDKWQPLINKCVQTYLAEIKLTQNKQQPVEVIITAGPNNNLILNYVYSESNTSENVTVQLFTKQYGANPLCNMSER